MLFVQNRKEKDKIYFSFLMLRKKNNHSVSFMIRQTSIAIIELLLINNNY